MTIERAIEVSGAAALAGTATFISLAKGTHMDQWLMWALSTGVGLAGAYAMFRISTENRLTTLETQAKNAATVQDVTALKGSIDLLNRENEYRVEVMQRMDSRIEAIAERLGVA